MPKKGELPPWLRKRKTKLCAGKTKKGTKDEKLAAARDARAKGTAEAAAREKGKSRACGDPSSKPGQGHDQLQDGAQHDVRALRVHAPHRQRAVLPLLSLRAQH